MAAALYNRYRPRTFAEVVGQTQVTDALQQALRSGRLHHAYLFSGPRGCGKTSSARILAASLNCVNGPTPEPCGVCDQCVAIRSGTSVDVVEIDAASHGGVDDARDLRERAAFTPASARFRLFIVDEAHMITKEGFNALLKVVEEPPEHVVFVFATTDPDKVLQTIRSRTFHYPFGLVPPAQLAAHLHSICEQEGVSVEPAVIPLVVRVAEGSVRDSLSVLDQLLAGVDAGGLSYAIAVERLGLTDAFLLDEALDALGDRSGAALFSVVERVLGSGADPRRFTEDLLERLRDLVLLDAVPDASDRGLLDLVPSDQLERMRAQAARLGTVELSRAADVVHAALVEMRGITAPRLALELLCARLLLPGAASDPSSLLVRLERLERRLSLTDGAPTGAPGAGAPTRAAPPTAPSPRARSAPPAAKADWPEPATPGSPAKPADPPADPPAAAPESAPAAPAAAPPPPAEPAPAPQAPVAAGALDVTALRTAWPQVLQAVRSSNIMGSKTALAALQAGGDVIAVEGGVVTVAFGNPNIARNFSRYEELLAGAIGEVVGGSWRVAVGVQAAGAAAAPEHTGFAPGDGPVAEDPDDADPAASSGPRVGSDEAALDLVRAEMGGTVLSGLPDAD